MNTNKKDQFLTGCEAALKGALSAGAEVMFGYPITPSTEILQGWITEVVKNKNLSFMQTEDETSAGFMVCGALLAGKKAFTATSGPGNILMQDPLSMAENMRLPFVCVIMQRGGPSTGTVSFSQQEVTLSAFGGNGDGLRIVYSASTVKEMYELVVKAFSVAWKYRFPTIVLGDGRLAKMRMRASIIPPINPVRSEPLLKEASKPTFLRNCYSSEEQFNQYLVENIEDWDNMKSKIVEAEEYKITGARELIIAHGTVADAAKDSIDILRAKKRKIGLFRPITLNPFAGEKLRKAVKHVKKVYIIESSLNQLSRIVKYECSGIKTSIIEISQPALSFSSEKIVKKILLRESD